MERKYDDDFCFDIITEGCFVDYGFNIKTIVIRLSCTALNEWIDTMRLNSQSVYDRRAEWDGYCEKKDKMRKLWEEKILTKFNFVRTEQTGCSITQNVSEIFTVVLFTKTEVNSPN